MAAEVSSRQIKSDSKSSVLITRDFLGGGGGDGGGIEAKELDLDLQLHVPSGWEKRLDLKSGKIYIQRCSLPSSSSSHNKNFTYYQTTSKLQDLNFPPKSRPLATTTTTKTLNLFGDTSLSPSLDLKLLSSSSSSSGYQSVCTLDKVKSALDRAERESSSNNNNKRSTPSMASVSSPSNSSSLSVKEADDLDDVKLPIRPLSGQDNQSGLMVAAACPGCLLYVLISKSNPKCPRCNSQIQMPLFSNNKKPRIDLNISI